MQTYTVIGVYEDNDLQTFVDTVEAETSVRAIVIACRQWPRLSIVALIPGQHVATAESPEFAGNYSVYNGMDGADEITDEERGDLE